MILRCQASNLHEQHRQPSMHWTKFFFCNVQVQAGRLGQQEASKLLRLAAALGLEGAKSTICRIQGHKALQVPGPCPSHGLSSLGAFLT